MRISRSLFSRRLAARAPLAAALTALLACGGGTSEPHDPRATVRFTATTTGAALPISVTGYSVALDGGTPVSLPPNGSVDVPGVTMGEHQVTITGVPPHCTRDNAGAQEYLMIQGPARVDVAVHVNCPGMIAFERSSSGTGLDIFAVAGDGSGSVLTLADSPESDDAPAWSPDGTKVAFVSDRDGRWDLYEAPASGGDATPLTSSVAEEELSGVWSPDGQRLAVAAYISSTAFIDIIAGGTRTHLSPSGYSADCPDWSPDGMWIAFSGKPTTGTALTGIYVMKADGSDQPSRLTPETTSSYCPVWSPDGTKLAYHSGPTGSAEIFVMNADGSGQQAVAPSPGQDEFPSWSPDGRHLAFSSDRDGHPGVYVVELGSSAAPQLVTGTEGGGYPRWRPY